MKTTRSLNNSPLWFVLLSHVIPWLLFGFLLYSALDSPKQFRDYIAKDGVAGAGLVENLTVIVLIPGIIAGFYAFIKYRKMMQPGWTAYWLLMWTLACIYFAGEEISWGQWFFQWGTPEALSQINDQNETNLHNISHWLDQKPRALVELWVIVTGLIFPLVNALRNRVNVGWRYWVYPIPATFSAAAFFTILKIIDALENSKAMDRLSDSEVKELAIALFLSLFLISYAVRLRQLKK